jgi:hypothetical protein
MLRQREPKAGLAVRLILKETNKLEAEKNLKLNLHLSRRAPG